MAVTSEALSARDARHDADVPVVGAFNGVHLASTLLHFRRSLAALRGRRRNIADPDAPATSH